MNRKAVKGIVLKEQSSGESDKLLFVLTESDGVILVKARGAKKISAAFLKSVQLFAYSEMDVYDKNGFLTLTEARLIESFYSIRENLNAFACASYLCELAEYCAVPGENEGILRLLLNSLYAITRNSASIKKIKSVFEYRLAMTIGFMLDTTDCYECGNAALYYDFNGQQFLCDYCVPETHTFLLLTESVLKTLNYLAECPDSRMLMFRLDDDSMAIFYEFAERFCQSVIEINVKSLAFFKSLEEN